MLQDEDWYDIFCPVLVFDSTSKQCRTFLKCCMWTWPIIEENFIIFCVTAKLLCSCVCACMHACLLHHLFYSLSLLCWECLSFLRWLGSRMAQTKIMALLCLNTRQGCSEFGICPCCAFVPVHNLLITSFCIYLLWRRYTHLPQQNWLG